MLLDRFLSEIHMINSAFRERLLQTLDLMEFGIALMRQNIIRARPCATSDEVEKELDRWLFDQPEVFIPWSSLNEQVS